jgi:DNA-binding response OmpR family regulator
MTYKILAIDDEVAIQFALVEYFSLLGYLIDCAKNTEEAQKLLLTNQYEIVLLDLCLNNQDPNEGISLLSFMKENQQKARVIILTAYGSEAIEKQARAQGAEFLHKPQPLRDLAKLMVTLLPTAPT